MKIKAEINPTEIGIAIGLIAIAVFIVFGKVKTFYFVNWDDPDYVTDNPYIRSFSAENTIALFTKFDNTAAYRRGNYHPFTLLSYTLDYALSDETKQPDPAVFHIHNLILHLFNSILVLILVFMLIRHKITALFSALLFAVHPMHVESVAWVSERKDVLYSFYMLGAFIVYHLSEKKQSNKLYLLSLILFLFSLLSKAQAVVLPVLLILTDVFIYQKKNVLSIIKNKIPFLALSLLFGIVAIKAQGAIQAVDAIKIPFSDSFFFACYGALMYLFKLFIPIHLTPINRYEYTPDGGLKWIVLAAPFILAALVAGYVYLFRKNKIALFGGSFFILSIAPVLQFFPVGTEFMAERYSYIPYIGLFIALVWLINNSYKSGSIPFIGGAILIYLMVSFHQTKVWANSIDLFTSALKIDPDNASALTNRAAEYARFGKYQEALSDYEKLKQLKPKDAAPYSNSGFVYNLMGEHKKAIKELNQGILVDSTYSSLYHNRGVSYSKLGIDSLTLKDYNTTLRLDSTNNQVLIARGAIFTDKMNQPELGLIDFKKAIQQEPTNVNALTNAGVALYKLKKFNEGISYLKKALDVNPRDGKVWYILMLNQQSLQQYAEAYTSAQNATQLGHKVNSQLMQQLELLSKSTSNKAVEY